MLAFRGGLGGQIPRNVWWSQHCRHIFFSWLYITPVGKWYFIFTYNSFRTLKSFTKEEVRIFCKKEYCTITVWRIVFKANYILTCQEEHVREIKFIVLTWTSVQNRVADCTNVSIPKLGCLTAAKSCFFSLLLLKDI